MAGDWIKMRSNLATDPDVLDIAAKISLDEYGVVGRLHALWSWADQHSHDGSLPRATSAFVDRLTACPGFAEALRQVGWLAGRDSALRLPNWERHNGETAKMRAVKSRQKQKERDKLGDKCRQDVANTWRPEKRREEKNREEGVPPPAASAEAPARNADTPDLQEFIRLCARFSVPEWYAQEKFTHWTAKQWAHKGTAYDWRGVVDLTSQDYENAGRPLRKPLPPEPGEPKADPEGWREWVAAKELDYVPFERAQSHWKETFAEELAP